MEEAYYIAGSKQQEAKKPPKVSQKCGLIPHLAAQRGVMAERDSSAGQFPWGPQKEAA